MNNLQIKKTFRFISFYFLPVTLLILSLFFRSDTLFHNFGTLAITLLLFNLYLKPLALLSRLPIFQFFMPYRRELGVAAFWSFFFHSINMIIEYQLKIPTDFYGLNNFLLYGGLAGIGMWLLGLTSNDFAVRTLKRNWQRLHRVAYAVLYLALYHYALVDRAMWKFYLFGGVYLVLKIAQFIKFKRI